MPRFYFHTEDGACFPDEEGVVLQDLTEAKRVAVEVVAEGLKGQCEKVWDTGNWRVICQNEDGLTLFTIEVLTNLAAAFPISAVPSDPLVQH